MSKIFKPALYGVLSTFALLGVYFLILTLVSGWSYALGQFGQFKYFIISLAVGFGIQIGLYCYLKKVVSQLQGEGRILPVTGATSTVAMISCCTHYLANLLPVIGVTGLVSITNRYQVEIFWTGIIFNAIGIVYISNKIYKLKKV